MCQLSVRMFFVVVCVCRCVAGLWANKVECTMS